MHPDYAPIQAQLQAAPTLSAHLRQRLAGFVAPLLVSLDRQIDARLVRTFLATLEVILCFRNRAQGLLLAELGSFLLSPERAPAGTKRLSNLLRSKEWTAGVLSAFLWQQATDHLQELEAAGEEALLLWEERVQEKPESLAAEGLCPVRSSKGQRLTRIKPGYYHPPEGRKPIFVPGLRWLCLLVCGRQGRPHGACMRWFSTRGPQATKARTVQEGLLRE
ncbi:MAG TPA: hypothetical protein VFB38_18420, partial [Chthonomonadaceae bacterium]|nr:hypothetical protein [Chthonomonadaceae bacterium]